MFTGRTLETIADEIAELEYDARFMRDINDVGFLFDRVLAATEGLWADIAALKREHHSLKAYLKGK